MRVVSRIDVQSFYFFKYFLPQESRIRLNFWIWTNDLRTKFNSNPCLVPIKNFNANQISKSLNADAMIGSIRFMFHRVQEDEPEQAEQLEQRQASKSSAIAFRSIPLSLGGPEVDDLSQSHCTAKAPRNTVRLRLVLTRPLRSLGKIWESPA